MIPLQNPRAAWAAAIFCQRHVKGGLLQSAEAIGISGRRGNCPACRCRTGLSRCTVAQQKGESSPFLCCERQAAGCRQVGGYAFFREFPDHRGHIPCLERFLHGPERVAWSRRAHDKKPRRIEAEEIATKAVDAARFECGKILLHDDHGASRDGLKGGQSEAKSQCRPAMEKRNRCKLMQLAQCQAAPEHGVRSPEGKPRGKGSAKLFTLTHFLFYVHFSF